MGLALLLHQLRLALTRHKPPPRNPSSLPFLEEHDMKTLIDKLFCSQKRVSWRRLAVLSLGTGLLIAGLLESTQWLYLSLAYIAGDSAEKAMGALGIGKK
jgi:hypothetical protein